MGSEYSHFQGINIEDKAVEVADFWSQHNANLSIQQLSHSTVFIGELFVSGPLWVVYTPLEKCSKNLMVYRHPCILKYISSWSKSSKFYLAVEHVKPLSHVFSVLNALQLCMGLHSILKALCFLHEKGLASHNNVCIASIYITDDGNWKLGGMEFVCKYNELTKDFLTKSKANRYNAAIDVNEEEYIENEDLPKEFIDTYGFFVLVSELLKSDIEDDVPYLEDFRNVCKRGRENINVDQRPKLSDLINHPFFNHEFIVIHSFLTELPLKTDDEKHEFFSKLAINLKKFNETLVASQLSGCLLSRMVLLNSKAQSELLPHILSFRKNDDHGNDDAIFSKETFKTYLVPRLLEIFCVRDAQIRLLLLSHFKNYIHAFSKEELQSYILPELLVGIKDTNDILVSTTLQALSGLVLILGANTVIGGKRAKLFTDGRPTISKTTAKLKPTVQTKNSSGLLEVSLIQNELSLITSGHAPIAINSLPERQRPDGEEVETLTDEVDQVVDEELEWEDWEVHENNDRTLENKDSSQDHTALESELSLDSCSLKSMSVNSKTAYSARKCIQDINELDIKNQKNIEPCDEVDFFQDMEPEITSSSKYLIDTEAKKPTIEKTNKLNILVSVCDNEDGWGEEDWG